MSHFKEVENLIADRLIESLATLNPKPRVYKGRDILNIQGQSQGDIAVYVAYSGIASVQEQSPATPQIGKITQEYLVWIAARSAKDHATQGGTKELADPVIEAVIESLMGLRLKKDIEPLHLVNNGLGPAYTNGFGYFPVAFHHTRTVRGKLRG